MQFITIQNQVGETIAVNPKQITLVCYGPNKAVLVHVGKDIIPTQFTDLLDILNRPYKIECLLVIANERSKTYGECGVTYEFKEMQGRLNYCAERSRSF